MKQACKQAVLDGEGLEKQRREAITTQRCMQRSKGDSQLRGTVGQFCKLLRRKLLSGRGYGKQGDVVGG